MKKLLLIAIGLIAAGSIALAIYPARDFARSPDCLGAQARADDPVEILTHQCLESFWAIECVQSTPGYCWVSFGIKHKEYKQNCCEHSYGDVKISVNGGNWVQMTLFQSEVGVPCIWHWFRSPSIELREGEEARIDIACTGNTSCRYSDSYTPYCSE